LSEKIHYLSHARIVDYWSSSKQNKYGGWIFIYPEDVDYPRCQCCGTHKKKWDKLERAHIVPDSIGGENIASNYLLLCSECHKNLPDINNREYLLQYVEDYLGDYIEEFSKKIKKYIQESKITNEELETMCYEMTNNKEKTREYLMENMSRHRADTSTFCTIRKIPKWIGLLDIFYKNKIRQSTVEKRQLNFDFDAKS